MVHTEEFLEKQRIRNEQRQAFEQTTKACRDKKKEITKAIKNHIRKLLNRARYEAMKDDADKYKSYLDNQKEYRDKHKEYKDKQKEARAEMFSESMKRKLKDENYRIVQGSNGKPYYITDKAVVYNYKGECLHGFKDKNGYTHIKVADFRSLHRLVWFAFNGSIPESLEVDHIVPLKNGGTNNLSNLRLVSHKANCNNELSIKNYEESWKKNKKRR